MIVTTCRTVLITCVVFAGVLLLGLSPAAAQQQEDHLLLGRKAPGFTLKSVDGDVVRLSDLKGRVVVLDFWATWCPPCVVAMPELQKLHERYEAQGVTIVGVNLREDRATVKRFVEQKGLGFTFVLDAEGRVGRSYRVSGIPQTVFIDREGVVQSVHVGFGRGSEVAYARELDALIAGESLVEAAEARATSAVQTRVKILEPVGAGRMLTGDPVHAHEDLWLDAPMPGSWFEHPNAGRMLAVVGAGNEVVVIGDNPEGETEARSLRLELAEDSELMDFAITSPDRGIAVAAVTGEFDLDGSVLRMQVQGFNNAVQPVWSADLAAAGKEVPDFTVRFARLTAGGLHAVVLLDYDFPLETGHLARHSPDLEATLVDAESTRLLAVYDFETGEVVYRDWVKGGTHGAGFYVLPGRDGGVDRVLIANADGLVPLTLMPADPNAAP
ncbi:TlpA family protein disulfide reductase [Mucisphaera calidilacus]|uniref:Thiol-disulfide oxidoreductase ResA n=1 Tax=Mucisphaera calidilacus TaxID=2527982 RepID=A0A518BTU9_9BACT|nr:TlpA disulfide reductase family protein [Mucisphaera calidilacus]QDU70398.1 Thiol-disulfide oxidoreductase ResA [Mucisphaera calidilacus]